jgi:Pentapeptide repeats (8 copies)
VAPAFARSADFAIDKPAGRPCPNLGPESGCRIHATLRDRGFPGCAVFDCFGAGQQVVHVTFAGQDWRHSPAVATSMFAVFEAMRQLKESLWHLAEARELLPAGPLRDQVEQAQARPANLANGSAGELEQLDGAAHRRQVGALLGQVSEALRADVPRRGADRIGADLIGANLNGANLRGISLRGAYLLGADLRGADLRRTDLLGADLRGADLRQARMATSLFLTQPQLEAAQGDARTSIPRWLTPPKHWA